MENILPKMSRIAATLFLVLGLAGASQATTGFAGGIPWQVGDVVICFGNGTCNVLRIVGGTPVLLDQISDGLGGNTNGVAINNTLHVVVTDDASSSHNGSNVEVYTIASVNPATNAATPHTVLSNFDGSGGITFSSVKAVAVDHAGNMFIGNVFSEDPVSIVELSVTGSVLGTFSVPPACATTLASLDVSDASAEVESVFFTALDGTIRQVSGLPLSLSSTCAAIPITQPAGLSPNITASGIRVLPSGSLSLVGNCGSSVTSPSVPCPNGGFLVVAKGTVLYDFDGGAGGDDNGVPDPADDTADICTLIAPAAATSCALLLDNTGSIVARYPITGVGGLQALALDPLVTDCTGNACASSYSPARQLSNFWVADSQSANFYEVDFATGNPILFNANGNQGAVCPTPTCSTVSNIQGIGIYGGESANQAGLAKLLKPTDITSLTNGTASVEFLDNLMNVTLYCTSSLCPPGAPAVPVALYASLIDEGSCFNDQTPPLPCRKTTSDATKGVVFKIDIPQGNTTLPFGAIVASKYSTDPAGSPVEKIDNGTDVFTDMFYDTTNLVGNNDPSSPKRSVHTLHEVPAAAVSNGMSTSGCFYLLPRPAGACFPAGPKLKFFPLVFAFQCPGLTPNVFAGLDNSPGPPQLDLVQTFSTTTSGPVAAPLPATNGGVPYQFVTKIFGFPVPPFYAVTLNWETLALGNYTACTFDPTRTVQTFCTTFKKETDCDNDADDH